MQGMPSEPDAVPDAETGAGAGCVAAGGADPADEHRVGSAPADGHHPLRQAAHLAHRRSQGSAARLCLLRAAPSQLYRLLRSGIISTEKHSIGFHQLLLLNILKYVYIIMFLIIYIYIYM